MKHRLLLIVLATLCAVASVSGQSIRTLGYNTTNGQIVAATNVVWTNAFSFSTNTVAAQVRTNIELGATWLTNANVTNFRTAIGLGATNSVGFGSVSANYMVAGGIVNNPDTGFIVGDSGGGEETHFNESGMSWYSQYDLMAEISVKGQSFSGFGSWTFYNPIAFNNTTNASTTRTNLGIPLPALTNTSNVTAMRALSGSTNTNHPFSGSVSVVGTNNTNTLVFSNGILQEVQ
jgi:hypothetical protein